MPTYRFRCDGCGIEDIKVWSFDEHAAWKTVAIGHFTDPDRIAPMVFRPVDHRYHHSRACGQMKQVLSFSFHRGMPEHFNHSIGQYVTNERAARDSLKRQSEETSARMGFDHQFELVDPGDPKAAGVTDAGLEATERRHREEGITEPKKFIST